MHLAGLRVELVGSKEKYSYKRRIVCQKEKARLYRKGEKSAAAARSDESKKENLHRYKHAVSWQYVFVILRFMATAAQFIIFKYYISCLAATYRPIACLRGQ